MNRLAVRARFGAVLIGGINLMSATASAAGDPPADCYAEFETGRGAEIACRVPLTLSEEERAELEAGSRGYVTDLTCTLTIRIDRALVEEAIMAADMAFESPEQPVACTIATPKRTWDITGTFAPKILIKNDEAVEATPGLGNVLGVTRVLSWPVVQFVNRWPSVRSGMLQVVNAYRAHRRKMRATAGAPAP